MIEQWRQQYNRVRPHAALEPGLKALNDNVICLNSLGTKSRPGHQSVALFANVPPTQSSNLQSKRGRSAPNFCGVKCGLSFHLYNVSYFFISNLNAMIGRCRGR